MNQLKQLGLVMKMYANESRGERFPLLDPRPGHLTFVAKDLYPEYLTDPSVLLCPADAEAQAQKPEPSEDAAWYFDHSAYWYLGYAVPDEETGLAFVEAYRQRAAAGLGFEEDYLDGAAKKVLRLREGVERFFITDIHNPSAGAGAQASILKLPPFFGCCSTTSPTACTTCLMAVAWG